MQYQRNKGGVYAAGLGLLGLLVAVGIMVWLFSETASVSMNSYKSSQDALDAINEIGAQRSEEAYRANRDPSKADPRDGASNAATGGGAPNNNIAGGAPVSPAVPVVVTPPVANPPPAAPALKKVVNQIPRQMPDRGAGKLMEEME